MSTRENKENELVRIFGSTLSGNSSALRECVNLLQIYRIEPETLHTKWEAYILSRVNAAADDDDGSMTPTHLEGFKNSLRRSLEQQSQQQQIRRNQATPSSLATFKGAKVRQTGSASKFNSGGSNFGHFEDISGNVEPSMTSPSRPTLPSQFAQRKKISETEESLNSHLGLRTEPLNSNGNYRNDIGLVVGVKPYRYMFEKILEKAEALDDRIDIFAELYKKSHPETVFGNPSFRSQTIITVIGRICSDANEGKSNERSLVLETSRSFGGNRVIIDLSEVPGFSFFPGQIVVLSGINGGGPSFAVTHVHELPPLPMAGAKSDELVNYHYNKLEGQPIKMIVASGPYTLNDSLSFEPFAALMKHVGVERPDILLLMGPFISSQHPYILSGNVDETPEQYFKKYFSSLLTKHQERHPKEMQILLVPSLQDIIHDTVVIPQPELDVRSLGLPPGTNCLPNPAQFTINEMVFAVNTVDILMHLSGEVERNPSRKDRLGRLSKYLVDQRSMYPVYPGPASDLESGVDFNQFDLMDLRVCPDVMILPSKLKSFAKIVDNIVVINPNQLCKAQSGGTFARLTIHPISQDALDEAAMTMDEEDDENASTYHQVYSRCRVDIIRV
ncbi:DNA-directed DNA polymerase alpha subunit pol12 [Entomortierella beljakovae]|nr:DNA-directed DNA polymerase alpha subunit pol12 [Entomortierella beljakovae]